MEQELMDIKQLCKAYRLKERTVRNWVYEKRIPVVRLGRLVRFRPGDLEDWIRQQNA